MLAAGQALHPRPMRGGYALELPRAELPGASPTLVSAQGHTVGRRSMGRAAEPGLA